MKILASLLIVFVICQLFGKGIKKYAPAWYILLILMGMVSFAIPQDAPRWLQQVVNGYITRGTLATAMFIWVMYARILPKGSKVMTNFMSLRAPLAIGGTLLILAHNSYYTKYYLANILKGRNVSNYEILAGVCSITLLVILIPLTLTSLVKIRRRMDPKNWKKLQKFSYVFYGLIYLHVFLLFSKKIMEGHADYGRELAIYTAIFGYYLVERVALYMNMARKDKVGKGIVRIGEPLVAFLCACIFFWPYLIETGDSSLVAAASENASVEASDIPEVLGASLDEEIAEETTTYQDGEYTGSGMGYNGPIKVSVEIENGVIAKVKVVSGDDDDPYYTWAIKEIPGAIVKANSTDVDTVSGATTSSKAIISAVEDALKNAIK